MDQTPQSASSDTAHTIIKKTEWYYDGAKMSSTEKFEAGKTYRVYVLINPDSDYVFSSNPIVTFNSSTQGTIQMKGVDYINCYVDFEVSQLNSPITSVSLTVTEPKAGMKPDYSPVLPSGAGCDVGSVAWFDETGEHWMSSTESFAAGHSYTVRVDLLPKDGYEFDLEALFEGDIAKVNGKDADSDLRDSEDGDYLRIKYTFTLASLMRGDLNSDGNVNQKDLAMLSKYMRNSTLYPLNETAMAAADINGDGSVNQKDLAILSKYMRNPELYPLS